MESELCRFEFRGGPWNGRSVMFGTQPCEKCGKHAHPRVLPFGFGEGTYDRGTGAVYEWSPNRGEDA